MGRKLSRAGGLVQGLRAADFRVLASPTVVAPFPMLEVD